MFHVTLMGLAIDVDGSGLSRSGENRVSDLEHDARAITRGHEWIRRWPGLEIPLATDSSFQSSICLHTPAFVVVEWIPMRTGPVWSERVRMAGH